MLKKIVNTIQPERYKEFKESNHQSAQKLNLSKGKTIKEENSKTNLVSNFMLKRLHNMYNIRAAKHNNILQKSYIGQSLTHRTLVNESIDQFSTNKKSQASEYYFSNHVFSNSKSKSHKLPTLQSKSPFGETKSIIANRSATREHPSFRDSTPKSQEHVRALKADHAITSVGFDGSATQESSIIRHPNWLNDSYLLKSKQKIVGDSKFFRVKHRYLDYAPMSQRSHSNRDFSEESLLTQAKDQDIFSTITHLKELLKPN